VRAFNARMRAADALLFALPETAPAPVLRALDFRCNPEQQQARDAAVGETDFESGIEVNARLDAKRNVTSTPGLRCGFPQQAD
jgi:hypothetical protein